MAHSTSGALQPQPEPLLSQQPPIVPPPHGKDPSSGSTPAALDAAGPCIQATPLPHTQLVFPRTMGRKNSLQSCVNSLARGGPRGTRVSQWLFASLQGAATKGRHWQWWEAPHGGKALPVPGGWQGRLAHPAPAAGPAAHVAETRPSPCAAPASGSQKLLCSATGSLGKSSTCMGTGHTGEPSKHVPGCCLPHSWVCLWPDPANNRRDAVGGYERSSHLP